LASKSEPQRICDGWKHIAGYWRHLPESDRKWISESAQQVIDHSSDVPYQETINQMLWLAERVQETYEQKT